MSIILVILVVVFVIIPAIGAIWYSHSKKVFREQKNFERGLKVVPMLIHLPPLSEDNHENGRDVRDLIDENISKSQVLYGIIASTIQKASFKNKFYGQRHFGFEIIASKGIVSFYAAVPIALVEVVKQAVNSAYPTAQLEEVAEHNIFSPIGKISGTAGGELTLKENFAYPIATYQELKRDAMQSILNSLSTLDKDDGAGIQLLMRPAHDDWRKQSQSVSSEKRGGESSKTKFNSSTIGWWRQVPAALWRPPEHVGGTSEKSQTKQLSALDQQIVDAIDDKTRHPGFEVLIRVIASSNNPQKAQAIKSSMVAAFSLFDAPGKNGFKYTDAADIESFATAFIMRFFPQENNKNILNSVELATLFHFPDHKNIPTTQLARQASKQVDGPRNMPENGLMLGYNVFRGVKKPIRLSLEDRRRHMYVVGQTGTGKSVFLENLALQDMLAGRGFAFVDPHGDTVDNLMSMVPKERTEDIVYFNPSDMDFPMGLNLFEFYAPEQKDFLIQESINMLYKLYDPQKQGIIGPRFERIFTNSALLLMADPKGGTFVDIPKLLIDSEFMKAKLQYVTDRNVLDFWTKEWPNSQKSNEAGEVTSWVVSKFGAFLSNEMMRNIIGQQKSSFNLRDIMDNKKILFVNLSKGRTGELNSKLLGMIFVMKFQAAAMSRADIYEDDRQDFCLYVDEFQNFATDSFATIMSEARKYRLNLIVANQFTTQLTDEIRDAVFGNVGTTVSFRVGSDADADSLSKKFSPIFEREDVLRIPNFNTITQMLIGGIPTQSFSMATLPPLGSANLELGKALKQLSAAKFGRAKDQIEKEIFARLKTVEAPTPAAPVGGQRPASPAPTAPPRAPGAPAPSFLDDWLTKRQTVTPAGAGQPAKPSVAPQTSQPQPPIAPTPLPVAPVASNSPVVAADNIPATTPVAATISPQIDRHESKFIATDQDDSESLTRDSAHKLPFTETTHPATETTNISSSQLEDKEIAGVAAELRESLNHNAAQPVPAQVSPEPVHNGELHLGKTTPASTLTEHVINIDRNS